MGKRLKVEGEKLLGEKQDRRGAENAEKRRR